MNLPRLARRGVDVDHHHHHGETCVEAPSDHAMDKPRENDTDNGPQDGQVTKRRRASRPKVKTGCSNCK